MKPEMTREVLWEMFKRYLEDGTVIKEYMGLMYSDFIIHKNGSTLELFIPEEEGYNPDGIEGESLDIAMDLFYRFEERFEEVFEEPLPGNIREYLFYSLEELIEVYDIKEHIDYDPIEGKVVPKIKVTDLMDKLAISRATLEWELEQEGDSPFQDEYKVVLLEGKVRAYTEILEMLESN